MRRCGKRETWIWTDGADSRENVSVWFDQYALPYELIYQMELDVDKTPATWFTNCRTKSTIFRCPEALNMTLLTTLEGCLNTCLT